MAASQEQKVDYLLKKLGYSASKTGIADVGIPAPLYAWNISAQPLVPESDDVHAELSGIQTKHPAAFPL